MYKHAPDGYDCPFCAMVRGDDNEPWCTQADVVHRDPKTTAWVNGRWWLNNPGGVIVVPNEHVENLYGLDRELAGDIHETARRIALAMRRAFRCEGTSTRQPRRPAGSVALPLARFPALGRRRAVRLRRAADHHGGTGAVRRCPPRDARLAKGSYGGEHAIDLAGRVQQPRRQPRMRRRVRGDGRDDPPPRQCRDDRVRA